MKQTERTPLTIEEVKIAYDAINKLRKISCGLIPAKVKESAYSLTQAMLVLYIERR